MHVGPCMVPTGMYQQPPLPFSSGVSPDAIGGGQGTPGEGGYSITGSPWGSPELQLLLLSVVLSWLCQLSKACDRDRSGVGACGSPESGSELAPSLGTPITTQHLGACSEAL